MGNKFFIELGKELSQIRTQRGMSQQYVADRLQISRSALSNYEQGRREMSTDFLLKLCDIYGIENTDTIIAPIRKYIYKR